MGHWKSEKSQHPRPSIQPESSAGSVPDTFRTAPPGQPDEKLRPATDRDVMEASPASGTPPSAMAISRAGEMVSAVGATRASGTQGEAEGRGSEVIGSGPCRTGGSGPQEGESDRHDLQPGPGGSRPVTTRSTEVGEATPRKSYRVDLRSVLEGLMGGPQLEIEDFDDYSEARSYVIEQLQPWIDELQALLEELRRAEGFDDLDLGWHEPLLEEVGDAETLAETDGDFRRCGP